MIPVKGKGDMETYFLVSRRDRAAGTAAEGTEATR
jgi:hypothetical protein